MAKQQQSLNSIWELGKEARETMTEDAIRDMLAKAKTVDVPVFPDNRYDALELAKDLPHLKQKDWHSLASALCKARKAWLAFSQGNVFAELRKDTDKLKLRIVVRSGSLKKSRNWRYNLEELVGAMSLLRNDRYACLDSIGNMLAPHSDWIQREIDYARQPVAKSISLC